MTKRTRNNIFAVLAWILVAPFILGGCAGQGVKMKVETSGTPCGTKSVDFQTDYQVENLEITRALEGGGDAEGCGGGYTIALGKGTTKDTEQGLYKLVGQMLNMMAAFVGIPPQPPPQPAED